MNKKILISILILSLTFVLVGCWDYSELDEKAIVSGAAIDKVGDEYEVTIEFISTEGSGQGFELTPITYTSRGITFFDAVRNLISKVGMRLYWAHAKIIVISEEIAREGLVPILDFISRDPELRPDIHLIVSREKTAREILMGEDKGHGTLSFHMRDMLKAQKSLAKIPKAEMWRYNHDLGFDGLSPILPTVHVVKSKAQVVPDLYGTALFKRDKMVGWIDGNQTKFLLLIRDELEGGLLNIIGIGEKNNAVTLEIISSKTKQKPIIQDGELRMTVEAKIETGIAELDSTTNFIDKEGRKMVKQQAEKLVKKEMENLIKDMQQDHQTDVFKFSCNVQRYLPDTWKEVKGNWSEVFCSLPVEVEVKVEIKGSALTSKPIKVSD
ncbi:spore germination protein KC [Desulfonispora thiosulfatigenes DSM 11270]|uniref:Spore germination protein KC n=1 Tax=Desulfonispora thiosulfatigenes DSM 11270 TaxID=656914 RepID=A0A1W1V3Y6_DESTI|nr:Ger(x)C family spore germination protein [Desulfonispora thiosulfatigenes]SMB87963.1 spore germination protein KC [Desulfonispora thiosulfatigenes DSM 11270]